MFFLSATLLVSAQAPDLSEGFQLESGGKAIDVVVGHASPFIKDWDGDGVLDLLVGEFGDIDFPQHRLPPSRQGEAAGSYSQSKLRIYKNYGTNEAPEYRDFNYLKAGSEDASIPST